MKVNTILFDLDGTLIDTNGIIVESFKQVLEAYLPEIEPTLDLIKTFIGPPLRESFSKYRDPETVEAMIKHYRNYYMAHEHSYYTMYPNVDFVLKELKKQGYYIGIVTSKFREAAWPSMVHFGIDKLIDAYVAVDDVEHAKPHREPVDKALSDIANATGAIMIGDNWSDVMSGKNAGILSAGVAWAFKGRKQLEEVEPDYFLEDMTDLLEILQQINHH
jgi:pyrophosphatase PpaX